MKSSLAAESIADAGAAPLEHFLNDLRAAGVRVWRDGDRIRFRAPAQLEEGPLIKALVARKQELLSHFATDWTGQALPPVVRQQRPDRIPLSVAQARWCHHADDPRSSPEDERLTLSVYMDGRVNVPVLEWALEQVVRRHEILRTTYHWDGAAFHQVVNDAPFVLKKEDLSDLPEEEREPAALDMLRQVLARPIRLDADPILDMWLFKMSKTRYLLAGFVYHIAFDDKASKLFWGEISTFYGNGVLGLGGELPPPELQYSDVALWERSWLTPDRAAASAALWERRLAGFQPTDLTARRTPANDRAPVRAAKLSVETASWEKVTAFAKAAGVTPVVMVLAAICICIHKISGNPKVLFGYVIHGRAPGLDQVLGSLMQKRPFAVDLSGDPTFDEILAICRQAYRDASHLRLPPSEAMVVGRDIGRITVNIVQNDYEDDPGKHGPILGVTPTFAELGRKLRSYIVRDLHVAINQRPQSLEGTIAYAATRFDHDIGAQLCASISQTLQRVVEDRRARLSELSVPDGRAYPKDDFATLRPEL